MKTIGWTRMFAAMACCVAMAASLLSTGTANAAGLLIADGGFGGVLKVEDHHVDVTINNGIAVTEITQVFRNTEDRQLEALYTFPVPKGASVSNFSMWINGKEMVGEVVEKQRAREIYNSYKQQRRDPGLLEQVDYKTFEMRIFPIGPKAEQRLQITYYQELDFDHDWATYVYPLATVTRQGIDQQVEGAFGIDFRILSEVPVSELKSPSHADAFVFRQQDATFHEASLEVQQGSLAEDVVLSCKFERPQTGADIICSRGDAAVNADTGGFLGLGAKATAEDGYFLLTVTAGKELEEAAPPMDYLFLIDVSGSMAEEGKLGTSTMAVQAFIKSLGPEERFEIMTFNTSPSVLFNEMRPANAEFLAQATEHIAQQRASGGTRLDPALQVAFRYAQADLDRQLNIVILSDGMTEQATRQTLLGLAAQSPVNARVFCVGVGNEVNRPLLQQVAEDADGLAAFISNGDDFARQAEAFRRKLTKPAVENVSVAFEGGEVYDVVPEVMPNLYHGQPLRVYGRYRNAGPVNVVLRGDLAGRAFEQTLNFELPEKETTNPEIERMWAWHKIQRLEREGQLSGNAGLASTEIVRLGEAYSIATEYTSFLVLENNEEYQRWKIERRNALRTGRDRTAQASLRQKLEGMRMAALDQMGPSPKSERPPAPVAANAPIAQPGVAPTPQRQQMAQATPAASPESMRTAQPQQSAPRRESRGFRISSGGGGGGGGGTIDPLSGGIVLGLVALGAAAKRRKQA
jgi:Ca-activated chloride channel family protein